MAYENAIEQAVANSFGFESYRISAMLNLPMSYGINVLDNSSTFSLGIIALLGHLSKTKCPFYKSIYVTVHNMKMQLAAVLYGKKLQ